MTRSSKFRRAALGSLAVLALTTVAADAAGSPSGATGSASAITDNSATLNGTANPNGTATSVRFDYGLTSSYGQSSTTSNIGKAATPQKVAIAVTGLIPGTVYHFHLVAINRYGETLGADRTFKTSGNPPPDATTGPASNIGQNTVTLSGVINPKGAATSYVFRYGTTNAYGYSTDPVKVQAGTSAETVSETLNVLAAGTTFHYTIVAYNGSTPVSGSDATFTTVPAVRPYPTLTFAVSPRSIPKLPFVITTSGKVAGPAAFPAADNCTGIVTIHYADLRGRQFATSNAPLSADCTWTDTHRLRTVPKLNRRHPTQRILVSATFGGNSYVAPRSTAPKVVRLSLGR